MRLLNPTKWNLLVVEILAALCSIKIFVLKVVPEFSQVFAFLDFSLR